ncbi:unnamed protein product [Blepharisma stoltei]|uniref:Serine aminopeptidase S33 domain-containing protein n=1 Tax=Blepharisma stoltei TaxID=1481888 RepID=A0AAU9I6K0_9CILI|nr:unnamed protein product [Blepharisma stoltei]
MSFFTNRNGLRLSYNFSIKNPQDNKIYIVCQWFLSDILFSYEFLCDLLEVNTFRFDLTGSGNSEGENTYAGYVRDAEDIDDAVKFVVSQGYEVEGIIGHSKASSGVIIYSALYGEVKNIIVLAPRFLACNIPDFIADSIEEVHKNGYILHTAFGKTWRITEEMIQEMMGLDLRFYCQRVQGNIYIIHGEADDKVPFSESIELVKELKEKCRGFFKLNCDHFFTGEIDEAVEIIHKIIDQN